MQGKHTPKKALTWFGYPEKVVRITYVQGCGRKEGGDAKKPGGSQRGHRSGAQGHEWGSSEVPLGVMALEQCQVLSQGAKPPGISDELENLLFFKVRLFY